MGLLKGHLKGFEGMTGDSGQFVHDIPNTYKKSINFLPQRDHSLINRSKLENVGVETLSTDKVVSFSVNRKTYFAVYDTLLINRWFQRDIPESEYRAPGDHPYASQFDEVIWNKYRDDPSPLRGVPQIIRALLNPTDRESFTSLYEGNPNFSTFTLETVLSRLYIDKMLSNTFYRNDLYTVFEDDLRFNMDTGAVTGRKANTPLRKIEQDRTTSSMWWQRFLIYDEQGNQVTHMIGRLPTVTENSLNEVRDKDAIQEVHRLLEAEAIPTARDLYNELHDYRVRAYGENDLSYNPSVSPEGIVVFTNPEGLLPPLITKIREFRENSEDEKFNLFGRDEVGVVTDLRTYYFRNDINQLGNPLSAPHSFDGSFLFYSWGAFPDRALGRRFLNTPEYLRWYENEAVDKENRYEESWKEFLFQLASLYISNDPDNFKSDATEQKFDSLRDAYTGYDDVRNIPTAKQRLADRNPFFLGAQTYLNFINQTEDSTFVFENVDYANQEVLLTWGLEQDFLAGGTTIAQADDPSTGTPRRRYIEGVDPSGSQPTLESYMQPIPIVLRKNSYASNDIVQPNNSVYERNKIGLAYSANLFKNPRPYMVIPYMLPGHYYRHSAFTEGRRIFAGGKLDPDEITFSSVARTEKSTPQVNKAFQNAFVDGLNLGLDFSFFAADAIDLITAFNNLPLTPMGGRETIVYPSGRLEISWLANVRHVLWAGTNFGSIPLKGIKPAFVIALSDDASLSRADEGSQYGHAPVIGNDVLFQVSDDGQTIYAIEDSLELRRRVYTSVSKSIEADVFVSDAIVQLVSNRSLGSIMALTKSGRVFYGLITRSNVRWGELVFTDKVKQLYTEGTNLFVTLKTGPIGKVSLNQDLALEDGVPLLMELNSPVTYLINSDPEIIRPRSFQNNGHFKEGTLIGEFTKPVGIGARLTGIQSLQTPKNGVVTFNDVGFPNVRDSLQFIFKERQIRLYAVNFYVKD